MKNHLVFVSDAHFGAVSLVDDKEREQKFIRFLEYFSDCQASIYIVGDLFEFWFEYKEVIPVKNIGLLSCVYQLATDTEMHYLRGNHDLWMNAFFENEIGLTIHKSSISVDCADK